MNVRMLKVSAVCFLFIYVIYTVHATRNEFVFKRGKSWSRRRYSNHFPFLPCHLLAPLKYFIKYFDAVVITWPYWLTFNFPIPFLFYLTYFTLSSTALLFHTSRPTFSETLELAVKLAYSEVSQFNGWVPQRAELSNLLPSRVDVLK